MFKNKHLVAAMIIAPILAIGAYFVTDYVVTEEAHSAENGRAYPLIAKSKCRYESGRCEFQNGDVEIIVRFNESLSEIHLLSNITLSEAEIAFGLGESLVNGQRLSLLPAGRDNAWVAELTDFVVEPSEHHIMLVATADQGSMFYGQSELTFAMGQPDFYQR